MNSNKRIIWMDYVRTTAIIFVVICHVIETEYYAVRTGKLFISDYIWYFENILFTIGRLGVPLFLLLSGALMLNREYNVKSFYKAALLPLFLTTEIWIILNYFYYCLLYSANFSFKNLFSEMTFMRNLSFSHMWYMPMILGIYLVIPLLTKVLKNTSLKEVSLPLLVSFIIFSILPLFNSFAGEVIAFMPDANTVLNTGFLGGLYGMLIIFGHFINNHNILKKMKSFVLLAIIIAAFLLNILGARFFYLKKLYHSDVFGWYASPFIIIISIAIFELIKRINFKKCSKTIMLISRGSFGIYLMHNLVLIAFNKLIVRFGFLTNYNFAVLSLIRFLFSFGIPFLIIFVADFLPFRKLKKLLLHMK